MATAGARLTGLARRCVATGAVLMLLGVVLGAFGVHVLQSQLAPQRFASFQTGVQYHVLHALGLVVLGIVAQVTHAGPRLRWSARLMLAGIAFFSGSIYLMTAGAPRWLGMVAPVGGVSFIAAWVLLAWHALRGPQDSGATYRLLRNPQDRTAMRDAATAFMAAHRGAADRLWAWLEPRL